MWTVVQKWLQVLKFPGAKASLGQKVSSVHKQIHTQRTLHDSCLHFVMLGLRSSHGEF